MNAGKQSAAAPMHLKQLFALQAIEKYEVTKRK